MDLLRVEVVRIVGLTPPLRYGKILSVTSIRHMTTISLDFKWYRDPKGYRLVQPKPIKRRPGQSILDTPTADAHPALIVRNGGPLQSYEPLDKFPRLFRYFIDMARSEDGVLKFIETYGPLTHEGLRSGEIVPDVIDWAIDMSKSLRGRIHAMVLSPPLNARIITEQGKMRLEVGPSSLIDALWLQLVQSQSQPSHFKECEQCGEAFMVGPGARRADARFCCDEHRVKFNSLERSR
jgi:hypothetical protein